MNKLNTTEARALVERLTGYTPEPWSVDDDGDVIARLGYMIADLLVLDGNQTAEDEANAHLIAAAPDLHAHLTAALDEIERLREALGEVIDCNHHNFTDGPPPKYVRIARAALKGDDQ